MWWKLVIGAVALGAAALCLKMLTGWAYQAGKLDAGIEFAEAQRVADKQAAQDRIDDMQRSTDAVVAMASSWQRLEPVIVHSSDIVRDYAKTPAGTVRCLAADRVRGIEETAGALGVSPAARAATAGQSDAGPALPADAVDPPS